MFALPPEELEEYLWWPLALSSRWLSAYMERSARSNTRTSRAVPAGPRLRRIHSLDVTFMALRGLSNYDAALARFGDHNLETVLDEHQDTFRRIKAALPEHATRMNFRPETAAAVLRSFGAHVSPDVLYALASKYHTSVVDIEGRRA